ncbi:hypothetical protein GOODEAATRI_015448 [Goodea atripinnis]|uniref:Uncharacterized protein n=1 Tax=Goodea atripinnis TaxID=208336 RepID=A0ABV0NW37_9TELE
MSTHKKHSHRHTQLKDTQQWTSYTHTPHTYSILPGPGTDTLEGQPAHGHRRWSPSFGVETGRLPQHQPRLVPAPPEIQRPLPRPRPSAPTPVHNDPRPHPERGPHTKEGCLVQMGLPNQSHPWNPPMNSNLNPMSPPTLHKPQHESSHRATPNQNTDITHAPEPKHHRSPPHRVTPHR